MAFDPTSVTSSFDYQDGFQTVLSSGISDSDTAIPLSSLPNPSEGTLVIDAGLPSEEEIYFTSKGGGNVNVPSASAGRGIGGTSAIAHDSGATVKMLLTKTSLQAITYGGAIKDDAIKRRHIEDEQKLPIGTVTPFAGSDAPDGWLVCDGSAVSRSTYAALFAVIDETYGVGDGSTTFNLPNLKGKAVFGVDSGDGDFDLADTGGAKTHTISVEEMPSHTHVQDAHTHTQDSHNHTQNSHTHSVPGWLNNVGGGGTDRAYMPTGASQTTSTTGMSTTATNQATTATNQNTTATNQNTGGGEAFDKLPPFMALQFIIKF